MAFYKIHEAVEVYLFPLFIFLRHETLQSVVLLVVIKNTISFIFTYLAGLTKIEKRGGVIEAGAFLIFFIWLLRILYPGGAWFYYFSAALMSLIVIFVRISIDSNLFRRAKEVGPLSASTFKNTASMLAKACLFLPLLFIEQTENVFFLAFLLAALASLAIVFLEFFSCKRKK